MSPYVCTPRTVDGSCDVVGDGDCVPLDESVLLRRYTSTEPEDKLKQGETAPRQWDAGVLRCFTTQLPAAHNSGWSQEFHPGRVCIMSDDVMMKNELCIIYVSSIIE